MLQGFVSNKDTEGSETQGDPLEAVLYAVFVATSARASVAELGTILQVGRPCATSTSYSFKTVLRVLAAI